MKANGIVVLKDSFQARAAAVETLTRERNIAELWAASSAATYLSAKRNTRRVVEACSVSPDVRASAGKDALDYEAACEGRLRGRLFRWNELSHDLRVALAAIGGRS